MEYMMIWLPLVIIVGVAILVLSIIFISKAIRTSVRRKRLEEAERNGLLTYVDLSEYRQKPIETMNADTELENGKISFYRDYFLWRPNNESKYKAFIIYYQDIQAIVINGGPKKQVSIQGIDTQYNFYLYKADTLREKLYEHMSKKTNKYTV